MERRAFKIAQFAAGNPDDALDLVQDAMVGFVRRYISRPESEWKALFYRTLQGRIADWRRRTAVRNRFRAWFGGRERDSPEDPLESAADTKSPDPARIMILKDTAEALEKAIQALPQRQQQAFLLRVWEGMDVAQTAFAMGCSEGSVKTHYSRAVHTLRNILGDFRP